MEQNIQVGTSKGSTCFACEKPIRKGERVIRFSFDVYLVLMKHKMSEEAHVSPCAFDFYSLLGRRLGEVPK